MRNSTEQLSGQDKAPEHATITRRAMLRGLLAGLTTMVAVSAVAVSANATRRPAIYNDTRKIEKQPQIKRKEQSAKQPTKNDSCKAWEQSTAISSHLAINEAKTEIITEHLNTIRELIKNTNAKIAQNMAITALSVWSIVELALLAIAGRNNQDTDD